MKDLIKFGTFKSHSGLNLPWKIECDSLSNNDIEAFAAIISGVLNFKEVIGVPTGGLRLAKALEKYAVPTDIGIDLLIVDDVMTSGNSMEELKNKELKRRHKINLPYIVHGVVLFSRCEHPYWIHPIFELPSFWR
jgi:orotate phosphoribosyltransferase